MNKQICATQLGDFLTKPQLLQPTTRQQFAWQREAGQKLKPTEISKGKEKKANWNVKLRAQTKQTTNA